MGTQKARSLSRITLCFFFFMILHLAEEFFIIPNFFNTQGVIACIGGLAILLIYIRFINKPLEKIGFVFSRHKIRKGVLLAALFNLVPAVIVFAGEFLAHRVKGEHTVISFFYGTVERSHSVAGMGGMLLGALIALALAVVHAFFYEMAFRGLMITLGTRAMRFAPANAIQSALYTVWFLVPVVRIVLFSKQTVTLRFIITLFVSLLIYEALTAVRLGLLRMATGSVWACIFDHIAFGFILDMVHMQTTDANMRVQLDGSYYARIIAYQAIALVMVFVYYVVKKKKIKQKHKHQHQHQSRHSATDNV